MIFGKAFGFGSKRLNVFMGFVWGPSGGILRRGGRLGYGAEPRKDTLGNQGPGARTA